MNFDKVVSYLKSYDGEPLKLMEVCGTHTASIAKYGIKELLSEKIKLVSGPGCPVCVTTTSYVDRLCELSKKTGNVVVTFGDLLRVRGSVQSLEEAKAEGGNVTYVYSPFDIIAMAEKNPHKTFIFAAIGFETTTPVYALILKKAIEKNLKNIKLLTSLKTMPQAIDWVCSKESGIDGFIAPGHVATVTGYEIFTPLAKKYSVPFVVAGFTAEQIIYAVYSLLKLKNQGVTLNVYKNAVNQQSNEKSNRLVNEFFTPDTAGWRGIGNICDSGLYLKDDYLYFDAGSFGLDEVVEENSPCLCAKILMGQKYPYECPLFKKTCTPVTPYGACMVSHEGACHNYYKYTLGD